jgi:hypothetical protein
MSERRSAATAWGLFVASLVLTGGCIAVVLLVGPISEETQSEIFGFVPALLFGATGAVIASNRSSNAIGWLLVAVSLAWSLQSAFGYYALVAFRSSPDLPGGAISSVIYQTVWIIPILGLPPVFLLFPDGRLLSSRWRAVLWASVVPIGAIAVLAILAMPHGGSRMLSDAEDVELVPGTELLIGISILSLAALVAAAVLSLVLRFRRSGPEGRRQIKLLLLAGVAVVVTAVTSNVELLPELLADILSLAAFAMIPLAIAMAVLRYRLYEIDRLINRTLVYAALTAVIAAVYSLSVVALQALLPTSGSDLAVAASTLGVAALFGPARRGIQTLIDRRFYRSRFDATVELEGFSAGLRDEVDLSVISDMVAATLARTLQPSHASLWLRVPNRNDSRTLAP